ncbi:hypothetical protein AVEN_14262-1 [Araneus ventricosus]|uniref:Uncharacterized protein n=1 Tax=Araneus ventricosus TaxID=182803 RepID=A0A4Y2KEI4_ARAVE|nr:hypothetical protein AVEN_14262-1 [Araneus ventricosus]
MKSTEGIFRIITHAVINLKTLQIKPERKKNCWGWQSCYRFALQSGPRVISPLRDFSRAVNFSGHPCPNRLDKEKRLEITPAARSGQPIRKNRPPVKAHKNALPPPNKSQNKKPSVIKMQMRGPLGAFYASVEGDCLPPQINEDALRQTMDSADRKRVFAERTVKRVVGAVNGLSLSSGLPPLAEGGRGEAVPADFAGGLFDRGIQQY